MARRRQPEPPSVAGLDVPAELLDAEAYVWHDRQLHERYMAEHGWDLDVRDRFQGSHTGAPPEGRRQAAVAGFALDNGITNEWGSHPDWHRLRSLGLIE